MRTLAILLFLVPAVQADPPSYSKDIEPLLKNYCAGCHGPRMGRAGYDVTDYDHLFKSKKGKTMLVKGEPAKSLLLSTMDGTKGKKMPPRKEKLQPTKAEIDLIRQWIKNGAKED